MDDLISRQAAIDALNGQISVTGDINAKAVQNYIRMVNQRLHDLPSAQPEQRWTPVSERLPKAGECVGNVIKYYLVQNEFGDMLVARYTHSGYWEQIYQYKPCADEIVAWMPLPPSYKEEQE